MIFCMFLLANSPPKLHDNLYDTKASLSFCLILPIYLVQAEPSSSDVFEKDSPSGSSGNRRMVESRPRGGLWQKQRTKDPGKLNIERNQVIAFALYTYDVGTLKLTAQLYPLLPEESREVRLV